VIELYKADVVDAVVHDLKDGAKVVETDAVLVIFIRGESHIWRGKGGMLVFRKCPFEPLTPWLRYWFRCKGDSSSILLLSEDLREDILGASLANFFELEHF